MADSGLWIYPLSAWSNLNFLHNSQWIYFTTQSSFDLYSFCIILLYSLIMWLTVSSLSLQDLHLVSFGGKDSWLLALVTKYVYIFILKSISFYFYFSCRKQKKISDWWKRSWRTAKNPTLKNWQNVFFISFLMFTTLTIKSVVNCMYSLMVEYTVA